ncbi:MAG: hypothetical protein GX640_11575 [Fibrobacter sp.]|nr:hypothetical protein [Fibrobacter sp.]
MGVKGYSFTIVFLFLFCIDSSNNGTTMRPLITIDNNARPVWYRDSSFGQIIYPSVSHCINGQICGFATSGAWDYTCTPFPDTFWGIIEYDFSSTDTVICYSDTARSLHDTTIISLKSYFARQNNAICSDPAVSYTQSPVSYTFSNETSVRVRNSCFDTLFHSSFSLPRLPLDTLYGVWFDTLFCPASLIDSLSGNLSRQDIINFLYQL